MKVFSLLSTLFLAATSDVSLARGTFRQHVGHNHVDAVIAQAKPQKHRSNAVKLLRIKNLKQRLQQHGRIGKARLLIKLIKRNLLKIHRHKSYKRPRTNYKNYKIKSHKNRNLRAKLNRRKTMLYPHPAHKFIAPTPYFNNNVKLIGKAVQLQMASPKPLVNNPKRVVTVQQKVIKNATDKNIRKQVNEQNKLAREQNKLRLKGIFNDLEKQLQSDNKNIEELQKIHAKFNDREISNKNIEELQKSHINLNKLINEGANTINEESKSSQMASKAPTDISTDPCACIPLRNDYTKSQKSASKEEISLHLHEMGDCFYSEDKSTSFASSRSYLSSTKLSEYVPDLGKIIDTRSLNSLLKILPVLMYEDEKNFLFSLEAMQYLNTQHMDKPKEDKVTAQLRKLVTAAMRQNHDNSISYQNIKNYIDNEFMAFLHQAIREDNRDNIPLKIEYTLDRKGRSDQSKKPLTFYYIPNIIRWLQPTSLTQLQCEKFSRIAHQSKTLTREQILPRLNERYIQTLSKKAAIQEIRAIYYLYNPSNQYELSVVK